MDRRIIYTGQVPLADDLLLTNKNTMIALGAALAAILGSNTVFDGLNCTPTSPASMQVQLAPGSVYSLANIDATAYSDIAADTTHQTIKQGILIGTTLFTLTAPTTTGNSINYLIQGTYQDQDTDSTVLPYFDSSNPAVAWAGPNNTGTSQNTTRKGALVLNLKPGTSATTGTQTTPAPDAGFTALWVVTVANGATTITSGNIAKAAGAPFINYKLPQLSPSGVGRTQLSANTQFNVNASTGSDLTGTGASGAPWQTIQHAINAIAAMDLNGFTATIKCASGTYAGCLINQAFLGGTVQLTGDTTTPTNCIISSSSADAIGVYGVGCQLSVAGFQLTTSGSGGNGLSAGNGGRIIVNGNMNYGAVTSGSAQIFAGLKGEVDVLANYTISAGAYAHASAQNNGIVNIQGGITATMTGSPAFAHAFFWIQVGSLIWAVGYSASGSGSGPAYLIQANSVLQMNGAGFTFTGATAGTADGSTFGLIF